MSCSLKKDFKVKETLSGNTSLGPSATVGLVLSEGKRWEERREWGWRGGKGQPGWDSFTFTFFFFFLKAWNQAKSTGLLNTILWLWKNPWFPPCLRGDFSTWLQQEKKRKKRGLSGEDNACYSDVTSLPQHQAQFQQCKKTPEAAVGDGGQRLA